MTIERSHQRDLALDQTEGTAQRSELVTARQVADQLGVSTETVLRWTRAGLLPGFRLPGGALRYRDADIEKWLAGRATIRVTKLERSDSRGPPTELSADRPPKTRGVRDASDPAWTGLQAQLW